jgi:hypothetical protein
VRRALIAFVLLLIPSLCHAIPAITCHCFTDRSYDPARPALADPYFLATTQNAFFAHAFGVDKKSIVIKKQQGVSSEDLWIAYALAARTGKDPEILLQERKGKGSWQQVAASLKLQGGGIAESLKTGASDERLAERVVDELLLRYRFYAEAELIAMRKAGAGNKELILAALLADRSRQTKTQIYRTIKSRADSWGGLLYRAKLNNSGEIQGEIGKMMGRSK